MSRWHLKGALACLTATSTAFGIAGFASADAARVSANAAASVTTFETAPANRERMGFY